MTHLRRALILAVAALSFATAAWGESKINPEITIKYLRAKDYGNLVDYLTSLASQNVPEMQFEVGLAIVLWLSDSEAKERPKYTMDDALAWIRQGAKEKDDRAMDFLLSAYTRGAYGLKKNDEISDCWGNALLDKSPPELCLELEIKQ